MMEKIKYIELDNLSDYRELKIDTTDLVTCRQPLFHGTTRLAIDHPDLMESINHHGAIILKAVKQWYLSKCNEPGFYDELDAFCDRTKNHAFCDAVTTTFGTVSNFSYGDFYLTTNYLSALTFSSLKLGELGKRAYYNALGVKELGLNLGIEESIDYIVDIYPQFENSERVILMIDNALFDDLTTERGHPLLFINKKGEKDYFFCQRAYDSEVSETVEDNNNYRLLNLSKYTFKLIRKEFFREGIGCFTLIKDYEKYLSKPSSMNFRIMNAEKYKI